MKIVNGFLDYTKPWSLPDVYLFTGNQSVTNQGKLVMGRGAALQVRDTYPGIDKTLADKLHKEGAPAVTYLGISPLLPEQILGYFRVKYHYRDVADLDLIRESVESLKVVASIPFTTPLTFHMNYPGIGAGHRNISEVEDIVSSLPDNVWLYK